MSARDVLEREPGSQADDRLTGRQVADLMARAFGLNDVDQEHLGGELDQNVKISARDGRCFLLKISSSDVDLDSLRWQNALLANLGANAPGVRIPEIVPGLDGQEIVALADLGAGRPARLFVWIDGCALGEVEYHPPALLQELGSMAGTIVGALATFRAPARQTRHEWDLSRAREVIADGIDAVEDPGLRADVGTIMGWYDDVADLLDELPVQVVHHDLNDANVLVDFDKGAPRICGVIDAGDALHTIRVAEIAVCAGYAMLRKADPLLAAATVISAFDALVPLTDEELRRALRKGADAGHRARPAPDRPAGARGRGGGYSRRLRSQQTIVGSVVGGFVRARGGDVHRPRAVGRRGRPLARERSVRRVGLVRRGGAATEDLALPGRPRPDGRCHRSPCAEPAALGSASGRHGRARYGSARSRPSDAPRRCRHPPERRRRRTAAVG